MKNTQVKILIIQFIFIFFIGSPALFLISFKLFSLIIMHINFKNRLSRLTFVNLYIFARAQLTRLFVNYILTRHVHLVVPVKESLKTMGYFARRYHHILGNQLCNAFKLTFVVHINLLPLNYFVVFELLNSDCSLRSRILKARVGVMALVCLTGDCLDLFPLNLPLSFNKLKFGLDV